MPLTRIAIPAGEAASCRQAVSDAVQEALLAALRVPMGEGFQVVGMYEPGALVVDPDYLGIDRIPGAIIVQVCMNAGRDAEGRQRFQRALGDGLRVRVGLHGQDVAISLVEVANADRSFGDGEAQLAS